MTTHCIALTYAPKIDGVRNGTIRQTIRRVNKRVYKVGDKLVLHGWEGKPYRSPWNWRTEEFTITQAERITITDDGIYTNNGIWHFDWDSAPVDGIAWQDGIVPPTGIGLKNILMNKNNKYMGEYWILRW